MFWHSWTAFIIERLKDCLHNPILITYNPLSSLHKQSQQLERALNSSTKSLSNQGISPTEKGDEAQGATLIWEQLGLPCGLSPWWSCASAWCLWGCKHNSRHRHKRKWHPWVQHGWSSQQQQTTWSVWYLPGGFLIEKALRQKVIIVAPEHSVIVHCEDKYIIKSRQRGRGRYSYYHPLEIYALEGWVLWVSGLDKSDEVEWV